MLQTREEAVAKIRDKLLKVFNDIDIESSPWIDMFDCLGIIKLAYKFIPLLSSNGKGYDRDRII